MQEPQVPFIGPTLGLLIVPEEQGTASASFLFFIFFASASLLSAYPGSFLEPGRKTGMWRVGYQADLLLLL